MSLRVQESSLRSAVLGEVRDELKQRLPTGGYRPYDATRVSKDVQDAFDFVAKDQPINAVISINKVVDVYAKTLKSSLDAINTVGPKTVTAKEAAAVEQPNMRERLVSIRADLARGDKPLEDDDLVRRAARFVTDHSAPIGDSGNAINVLFPAFDVGNAANWSDGEPGISASLITDPKAAVLLMQMFMGNAGPGELSRLKTFDPAKERLIVVADSDDETHYFPAAIDKKTGKARGFDSSHNSVDFLNPETKEDFEKMFGKGSAKGVADDDYASAAYDRLQSMLDKGKALPIAKMDPPEIDTTKLTTAAAEALQTYFAGMTKLPAGDFSADDKKTLLAIRDAVKAGETITIGEKYGDPTLLMPRKFSAKPTEDYAIGWAMMTLYQSVPELNRFYNVNSSPQTPNA